MVFQHGTKPAKIINCDVLDPKHGMRIADVHNRRRVQDRIVDRSDLQFDAPCIVKGLGKWNLIPSEPRLAHIDCDAVLPFNRDIQNARKRFEFEVLTLRCFLGHPTNAAHAIAARLSL